MSVANHHVGGMMGVTVNPCLDSTVSYVVAEFRGVCGVQYITCVSLFESGEGGKMVSYDNYLLRIALVDRPLDERKVLFKLIVYVLWNQATLVVENLRIIVHAILDSKLIDNRYSLPQR